MSTSTTFTATPTQPAKKIRIVAELKLISPMQVTALEPGRYSTDTQQIRMGDKKENGLPCTLTRKLPVQRFGPTELAGVDGEEGKKLSATVRVPVIPASTLCGKLRNAASRLIEESIIARKQTIKPATFSTMRSGAATATMRRAEQGVRLALAGAADPFLGIFGGTSFAISANLITHEAYAYTVDSAPMLRWQPRTLTAVPTYSTTGAIPIVRKNQIYEWSDSEHMVALMGEDTLIDYAKDMLETQAASKAKKLAGEAGKKEDLRTVAAAEVVTPGTGFVAMWDLTYRNQEQLGLFLLALREVFSEGQVGGRKAKGGGQFTVEICKALVQEDGAARELDVFASRVDGAKFEVVQDGFLGEAVVTAESWLEEVDAARYEAFSADDAPLRFVEAA
jgi:CRISPR type IV-associated protein Csf2